MDTLLLLLSLTLCQTARTFQVPPSIASSLTMKSRSLTIIEPNLSMKHLQISSTSNSAGNATNEHDHFSLRDRLRQVTGFSFTAFRATLRGITGISLTAIYASAVASTSFFVRNAMKVVLSVFPSWFRYFLQPFLVMYYVPLFIIRGSLGPSVKDRRVGHEHLVESWRSAVQAAEEAQHGGYWPVHVNEDGKIIAVRPPDPDSNDSDVDIADAVADSVELSMEKEDETSD